MSPEKKAISKDTLKQALAAYSLAMKMFHKGNFEKAFEALKLFLDKFPNEKELLDRAQIYLEICARRLDKEKEVLDTFDDYYQFGIFKMNQGEYQSALKALEKAFAIKPKESKVLYLTAVVYNLLSEKEKCLEYLEKAIKQDEYFSILAQNESDFEELWEDQDFKTITKKE